jgi:hypothetical protein
MLHHHLGIHYLQHQRHAVPEQGVVVYQEYVQLFLSPTAAIVCERSYSRCGFLTFARYSAKLMQVTNKHPNRTARTDVLATLNPQQRAAATYGLANPLNAGPLLVIAGAGSGKTLTLAARVTQLVLAGCDPARILLVTFSRRAAAAMERRVGRLLRWPCPPPARRRVWPGAAPFTAWRRG